MFLKKKKKSLLSWFCISCILSYPLLLLFDFSICPRYIPRITEIFLIYIGVGGVKIQDFQVCCICVPYTLMKKFVTFHEDKFYIYKIKNFKFVVYEILGEIKHFLLLFAEFLPLLEWGD